MTLDAVVIAALALASAAGALAGALRPLFLAAGAALGWLAARRFSMPASRLLERALSPPLAQAVAAAVLFGATLALVTLIGRALSRGAGGERRPADRAAGALLAGAAAGLAAWVVLAAMASAASLLPRGLERQMAESDLAALVREHDLAGAWRRPAEEALRQLVRLASDPHGAAWVQSDPDLRGLLDDRRVQEIVEESRSGAPGADPGRSVRALHLLADPDFRDRLEAAQERLDREGPRR